VKKSKCNSYVQYFLDLVLERAKKAQSVLQIFVVVWKVLDKKVFLLLMEM
jgi:hypothetical protein